MRNGPAAAALVACLAQATVSAQQSAPPAAAPAEAWQKRRWEISLWGGGVRDGLNHQLKEALRQAGLDDMPPDRRFMQPEPVAEGNGGGAAEATYRFRPGWWAGVTSSLTRGNLFGYRSAVSGGAPEDMYLYHGTRTVSVLVSRRVGVFRVGAGPAVYTTLIRRTDRAQYLEDSVELGRVRRTQPGLLIQAGATFPTRSRVFVGAKAEYHYMRGAIAGPFPFQTSPSETFSPHVPFKHLFLTGGMGMRF